MHFIVDVQLGWGLSAASSVFIDCLCSVRTFVNLVEILNELYKPTYNRILAFGEDVHFRGHKWDPTLGFTSLLSAAVKTFGKPTRRYFSDKHGICIQGRNSLGHVLSGIYSGIENLPSESSNAPHTEESKACFVPH